MKAHNKTRKKAKGDQQGKGNTNKPQQSQTSCTKSLKAPNLAKSRGRRMTTPQEGKEHAYCSSNMIPENTVNTSRACIASRGPIYIKFQNTFGRRTPPDANLPLFLSGINAPNL
ncbi:hypothetical protein QYF36_022734 [Acer negundo]|nr:hypothetical protein QYF36_022734 [Acer negundo]